MIMGDFMEKIFNKLIEIIKNNEKFLIMTHKNPDFDGIGSAIALQQIINSFNKDCLICVNNNNKNNSLLKAYDEINKQGLFYKTINKSNIIIEEYDVLIILDTHKKEMLELPNVIDKASNIIILDHHIKSKNYINKSILSYINSNISSTVEIIVEFSKYLNKKINPLIATFMLVGLEIDTNNFKLKTTPKTYETAAYLAKMGADNILKQELLQENKEIYLKRQKLIEQSYMINENMILCVADMEIYENKDLAAMALDLLQFESVEASFVIAKIKEDTIGISARSIGEIDVEKIMTKLGGGGHKEEAATQIKDKTLDEVKQILIKTIGE